MFTPRAHVPAYTFPMHAIKNDACSTRFFSRSARSLSLSLLFFAQQIIVHFSPFKLERCLQLWLAFPQSLFPPSHHDRNAALLVSLSIRCSASWFPFQDRFVCTNRGETTYGLVCGKCVKTQLLILLFGCTSMVRTKRATAVATCVREKEKSTENQENRKQK